MTDEMYEKLKREVFTNGLEAIEDLLGYEINPDEDKNVTENRIDDVLDQMPEDIALKYYNKYCA